MTITKTKLEPFHTPRLVIDTTTHWPSRDSHQCLVYAEWSAQGKAYKPQFRADTLSKRGAKFVMKDGVLHVWTPVKSKTGLTLEDAVKAHGPKFKVADLRRLDADKEPKFVLVKATAKENAHYTAWLKAVDAWYGNHVRAEFRKLLSVRHADIRAQIKDVDEAQRDLDTLQKQLDHDEAAVHEFLVNFN